jgi:hypothetical protein
MGKLYKEDEIKMLKTYRFEGESGRRGDHILIKVNDGAIGYSIDAYGTYANQLNDVYTGL